MDEVFANPFIERRADPWVLRHGDGRYYYTATVPSYDRIILRGADTLAGLRGAEETTLWEKHATGPMSHLIWAPELHHLRGRWYIYFAAAPTEAMHPRHGTFQHRMFALAADAPEGPWEELGQIDSGMDSFCLDATAFELDGRLYYLWAQKDPAILGNSNLYIAEMQTPWQLKTSPVLLSRPQYDWECSVIPVNEGPAVLVHGDDLFLTYSANATGPEYCMGMLRARRGANLLDAASWKKEGRPVFASCPRHRRYGPGHNSFTTAQNGAPVLVYHVREEAAVEGDPLRNPGRHTCLQRFSFAADGLPVFGVPAGPRDVGDGAR